jgi:hypothetical protein
MMANNVIRMSARIVCVIAVILFNISCQSDLIQPQISRFIHADSVWLRIETGSKVWIPSDSNSKALLFGLAREHNDLELIAWSTTFNKGVETTPTFTIVLDSLHGVGTYSAGSQGAIISAYNPTGVQGAKSYAAYGGSLTITSFDTVSVRSVDGVFDFQMASPGLATDTIHLAGSFKAVWN